MINAQSSTLIPPYGGRLASLIVPPEAADGLKAYASQLPSIQISPQSVCELELLATGALSPLDRFMGQEDYRRVLDEMRLSSGEVFPMPVTLAVEAAPGLHLDRDIALRNSEFELLGVLTVEEIYPWDRAEAAEKVYGSQGARHPHAAELHRRGELHISGRLQALPLPARRDFAELRLTPTQARERLAELGLAITQHGSAAHLPVLAYQPQPGLPSLNEALLRQAVEEHNGLLMLQLAAGMARPGDFVHYHSVRIYQRLAESCSRPERVLLTVTPLDHRPPGARETLLRALVSRNYGASYVVLPAGPEREAGPNASARKAQHDAELVTRLSRELGVTLIHEAPPAAGAAGEGPARASLAHAPQPNGRAKAANPATRAAAGAPASGPLETGSFAEILAEMYPPRHRQGVCIWFTGLSGSGKSTTAQLLAQLIMEHGRRVTVLDGDVVRTHLSKGLGFSKEDRDTNVRRIGFVAAELVRIGGVVICSVVSPYRAARDDARGMVGSGQFVEVYVDTPLEVCEARDVKGMYARARQGKLNGFTGIDDPYEPPEHPEITLDTVRCTPQENAARIAGYLIQEGFLRPIQSNPPHKESER